MGNLVEENLGYDPVGVELFLDHARASHLQQLLSSGELEQTWVLTQIALSVQLQVLQGLRLVSRYAVRVQL